LYRISRYPWRASLALCAGSGSASMTGDQLMTVAQAATLKRLAEAAYELDTFKPNLTRT